VGVALPSGAAIGIGVATGGAAVGGIGVQVVQATAGIAAQLAVR